MSQIFLSFVHEDEAVASAVKSLIETELRLGGQVFMSSDQGQVFAGDVWLDKIKNALQDAEVVVLLLSRRSVARAWVNFEAGGAWLQGKVIIPCCFGELSKTALPHPYSSIQAVDLSSEREVYYLLTSIHRHLRLDPSVKPNDPFIERLVQKMNPKVSTDDPIAKMVEIMADRYGHLNNVLQRFHDA